MLLSNMLHKYKKIILDVLLSLCASGIPLLVLQLGILPLLAREISPDDYGLVLTIVSVVTVVAGGLGNSLNNIRLIKQTSYEQQGQQGDFSVILIAEMFISVIFMGFILPQFELQIVDCIFLVVLTILWLAREYFIVIFRIELNFRGIVASNIALVIGYILGYLLFLIWNYWELIYIVGMLFSLIYIIKVSSIFCEKLVITVLFKNTVKELFFLTVAAMVNSLLSYADRLVIYPFIGGAAVSVYYASTLFGKVISMAIQPLNSVLLSYLAKKKNVKSGMWGPIVLVSFVIAGIGYFLCRIIAYPALAIVYPQWVDEAITLVPITTAIAMIAMIISILSPFILKFCKMKWQLVINISVLVTYLLLAISFYRVYGMVGFCIGVLLSNIVKLIIMMILGFWTTKKRGEIV